MPQYTTLLKINKLYLRHCENMVNVGK